MIRRNKLFNPPVKGSTNFLESHRADKLFDYVYETHLRKQTDSFGLASFHKERRHLNILYLL